jgi:hypothetical protein
MYFSIESIINMIFVVKSDSETQITGEH